VRGGWWPLGWTRTHLGDEDDLDVLVILLEERVGDVQAGVGASENDDGLGHFEGTAGRAEWMVMGSGWGRGRERDGAVRGKEEGGNGFWYLEWGFLWMQEKL
jgi:hypothetical protein